MGTLLFHNVDRSGRTTHGRGDPLLRAVAGVEALLSKSQSQVAQSNKRHSAAQRFIGVGLLVGRLWYFLDLQQKGDFADPTLFYSLPPPPSQWSRGQRKLLGTGIGPFDLP